MNPQARRKGASEPELYGRAFRVCIGPGAGGIAIPDGHNSAVGEHTCGSNNLHKVMKGPLPFGRFGV